MWSTIYSAKEAEKNSVSNGKKTGVTKEKSEKAAEVPKDEVALVEEEVAQKESSKKKKGKKSKKWVRL